MHERFGAIAVIASAVGRFVAQHRVVALHMMESSLVTRDAVSAVTVAAAYFLGAEVAFSVGTLSNLFAPLWPPNMILLCAFLMAPYRVWWLYVAATLPAHVAAEATAGMPAVELFGAFLCNISLALGVAFGLRRLTPRPPWLGSLTRVRTYIIVAAIAGPGAVALSIAIVGLLSDAAIGNIDFALRWGVANLTGALTLAPLLICCIADRRGEWRRLPVQEGAQILLVFGAVTAGAYLSFAFTKESAHYLGLACIVIPPILWATVRFGMPGASGAICIATLFAMAGAIRGLGPFVSPSPDQTIFSLQLFLAVMSAPFLILAAVFEERQRTLAQISLAERKLQSILDNTPACITVRDVDGKYVLANRAAQERAHRPSNFISKRCGDLFTESTASYFHDDDAAAMRSLDPIVKEETIELADGLHVYLSSKFALRGADGAIYGVCTIATDITDRKRSLEALEASETKFRVMAETVPAILFTADRNGNWEYASQRFFDFAGLPTTIDTIPDWTRLIHSDDLPRVGDAWRRSISMGEIFVEELRIRAAAGDYYWFAVRCRPIRNAAGEIERWFGVAFEINGMKTIERDLRLANTAQAAILDGISDYYYTLNDGLRITAMNAKAARAAGVDPQQAVGRRLLEIYPRLRGTKMVAACRRALRRGVPIQLEMQVPGSEEQWLEVNIYTVEDGISVFSRDISDRKRTERALYNLSSRLLSTQDEERRRIARELHDGTAQNMMAVMLNLGRVANRLAGDDSEGGGLLAEASTLIEQSLTEIRTLSYWLHPPLLDEVGLLPALRWYIDGFTKRSGIKIELQSSSAMSRPSPEIETALFRVVQECLGNVHRHSGGNEAIIRLHSTATQIVLTVIDNGRGMSVDETLVDANDISSLGVGLAGMNARLKQLGGQLEIASSKQGTAVKVIVGYDGPRIDAENGSPSNERSTKKPTDGGADGQAQWRLSGERKRRVGAPGKTKKRQNGTSQPSDEPTGAASNVKDGAHMSEPAAGLHS